MVSVEKKLEKFEEMIPRLLVTCQVLTWLKILLLSREQGEGIRNQGQTQLYQLLQWRKAPLR